MKKWIISFSLIIISAMQSIAHPGHNPFEDNFIHFVLSADHALPGVAIFIVFVMAFIAILKKKFLFKHA